MLADEIDLSPNAGGRTEEAQGDLMAFERSHRHRPRHMRRESLAHANGQLFSSIKAAIEYSQNGVVLLQRDYTLTETLVIDTPGITLDLGGHTLAMGSLEQEPEVGTGQPPSLKVLSSGVKLCNGHILIASGAWQGILVECKPSRVDLLLEDVDVTYKGGGYAVVGLNGSIVAIDTNISSTGSGIHLASRSTSVSLLRSQVIAVQCGISMWNGRLLLEDSSVQGRHANGLFVKAGWADISFSTISSLDMQAIVTRAASPQKGTIVVRVRNGSQIDASASNAMQLRGGSVIVEGSMLRSMKGSAVVMGVGEEGLPPETATQILESTKLTLQKGTAVSAWLGDGVRRGAGELVIHESCEIDVEGEMLTDDEVHEAPESEAASNGDTAEETTDGQADQQEEDAAADEQESYPDDAQETDDEYEEYEYGESAEEELLLTERPVSKVRIDNVQAKLDARKPVEFTARIGRKEDQDEQIEILFEQWSDGTDVIISDEPREPIPGSTYHYILALRAKDGFVFPNHFDVLYKGSSVGHSVMISLDRKIAMVSWGLSVNVSRGRGLRSPLTLVRKS